jgi:choline dehydrogenase-like flavoprotein
LQIILINIFLQIFLIDIFLLISGIGPRDQLLKYGIPVIVDSQVGHNLQDHVNVAVFLEVFNKSSMNPLSELTVHNLYELFANHRGVLSEIPTQLIYFNSKLNEDFEWPDILNHFLVLALNANMSNFTRTLKDQNSWQNYFSKHLGQRFMSSSTILVRFVSPSDETFFLLVVQNK